jgi:Secretion system C-terminal sorting domain
MSKSKNKLFFIPLLMVICFSYSIKSQTSNPNFFPIGVWLQEPHDAQDYKNAGINLYIGLWNELDQPQLSDLSNAGMKVICDQNSFGLSILSDTTIYGWMQNDEPDNAQWNSVTQQYDSCINPNLIISFYDSLKLNDPSHPVLLNLGQGVSYIDYIGRGYCHALTSFYPDYLAGCDIGSFDIYPVNNSDTITSSNLWYVAKGIDSLLYWSGNSKPVWCFIETTKIGIDSPRKPTTSEVKSEVWMALIHGAKGFGYFCHSFVPPEDDAALLHDTTMLSAITNINNEIASLAPVLNSPDTINYATVISNNPAVPIDYMTKNYGGENYIFAVAMRNDTSTATFSVTSGTDVIVIGENRNLIITGGSFSDNFTSYGVHLYKITGTVSIKENKRNQVIRISPNPVSSFVKIELSENIKGNINLKLFDCTGRIVYESTSYHERELILNCENLSGGMYFYSINIDQQHNNFTGKLIIE